MSKRKENSFVFAIIDTIFLDLIKIVKLKSICLIFLSLFNKFPLFVH
jgi:hypothetical protein